ncbi:Major facilitator superfamily domain-containing protein 4B [Halotydeus destructor]|nr:Major facilitator superfamily domain-containing protein 4B [Halotydeus destructor]
MELDLAQAEGHLTRKAKYSLTAAICFCYFSYGLGFSLFGPTLHDLSEILNSSVGQLSYGFVGRSTLYCVGALFCGWIFNYYNRQLGVAACLVGCAISILVMPYMKSLQGFILAQAALGFAAAGVDVGGNAWLLEIWKEQANPYMQSMHFFYALGMTFGPILCEPFLSPDINRTIVLDNSTIINFFNVTDTTVKSQIHIPYSLCSAVLLAAAMLQIALFYISPYKGMNRILGRKQDATPINSSRDDEDEESTLIPVTLPKRYYVIVIVIGGLLLCFEAGLEQNTMNYLSTFVVHVDLKLSKSTGAFMTSAMSASYTISRLLSIFLATRLPTVLMLYLDFAVMLVGNVLVLKFCNTSEVGLWIGLIVMGFGFSSCFPAIYSFLEERINVTNTVCGIFMFASSIATTIEPLFEGQYIEEWPEIFVYINVASVLACVVLFVCLHYTDHLKYIYSRSSRQQQPSQI